MWLRRQAIHAAHYLTAFFVNVKVQFLWNNLFNGEELSQYWHFIVYTRHNSKNEFTRLDLHD